MRSNHPPAEVQQFDAGHVQAQKIKAHSHHAHRQHSTVHTRHECFGEACDALAGVRESPVVGAKTAQADFRHDVEKHRPALVPQLVGYETVDQPTPARRVAFARQYFLKYDRMAGTPTPT